jgi:hypothetical protein
MEKEEKNVGLIYGINNNERPVMIISDKVTSIEVHNDVYLKFYCTGATIYIDYKGMDLKKLMFDLTVFLLDPSQFDGFFFINVDPKEILGVDLEKE